jgi:hypothetical protein
MNLLVHLGSEYLPRLRPLEALLRERYAELRFQIGMADVSWGAPQALVEDSLDTDRRSNEEWPEADEQTSLRLGEGVPRLLKTFNEAVARGEPPS